jgi:hypothetical protein
MCTSATGTGAQPPTGPVSSAGAGNRVAADAGTLGANRGRPCNTSVMPAWNRARFLWSDVAGLTRPEESCSPCGRRFTQVPLPGVVAGFADFATQPERRSVFLDG